MNPGDQPHDRFAISLATRILFKYIRRDAARSGEEIHEISNEI